MTKFKEIVAGIVCFISILVMGAILCILFLGGDAVKEGMTNLEISLDWPPLSLELFMLMGFLSAGLVMYVTLSYLLGYEVN
jgi:hypothetical protein